MNGLEITMVGDLKNGRTVHSLVRLLSLYSNVKVNYVSPPSLRMPREIVEEMTKKGMQFFFFFWVTGSRGYWVILHWLALTKFLCFTGIPQREFTNLIPVLPHTDVLYVTRIQKERFATEQEYLEVKGSYIITPETLSHAKVCFSYWRGGKEYVCIVSY